MYLDHDVLVLVPPDALLVVDDWYEDLVEDVGPRLPEGVVRLAPASHQPHLTLHSGRYIPRDELSLTLAPASHQPHLTLHSVKFTGGRYPETTFLLLFNLNINF